MLLDIHRLQGLQGQFFGAHFLRANLKALTVSKFLKLLVTISQG